MEDTGQDGVSSPATPGASKSKLDTLPKEDLIKFAKKQMMIIQKVKSRCTELEKEVETLKSKPVKAETDDVVQALTERLDMVLLEKAEAQQQVVSMKKELAKTKHDAEGISKAQIQEIQDLKNELFQSKTNHNEDFEAVKRELQDALMKQKELTDKLSVQKNEEVPVRRLEEELQNTRQAYEEKLSSLEIALEIGAEQNRTLTTNLKQAQADSEKYYSEIKTLHSEILNLQTKHNKEVNDLMRQLESSTNQSEQEKIVLQDLIKQYVEKERILKEEIKATNQKNGQEVEQLRKKLEENCNVPEVQSSVSICDDEKVQQLESHVRNLESQQNLLKDELTYVNNLKNGLEKEVEHLKSEYFHEREELEFKINELQLAIEDFTGLTEKLQTELQTVKNESIQISQIRNDEVQILRENHKKELFEIRQSITSKFEDERTAFVHEIQLLKNQVDKINQEKEEALNSYEGLRETFLSLQSELGESAGKISREFEAMKQQQATDVHELQQKLRAAYKDKNDLLETVNRLQSEIVALSTNQGQCQELQLKLTNLEQKNEEVLASLQQKEKLIQDVNSKSSKTTSENVQLSSNLQLLNEELQELKKMYSSEQVKVETLKQEMETYVTNNKELQHMVDELKQKLQEMENKGFEMQVTSLQQKNEEVVACLREKDTLIQELQQKLQEMIVQHVEISTSNEGSSDELQKIKELYEGEATKALILQSKADEQELLNTQLKQYIEKLTHQLQEFMNNKDHLDCEITNLQQQVDLLTASKENLETELKKLHDEAAILQEEKEVISRDFARLVCEHSGCEASKEELDNLKIKLQMASEAKDTAAVLLEQKELAVKEVKSQLGVLQDLLAVECSDQNIDILLQVIKNAVLKLKDDDKKANLLKEETSVQLDQLQLESESQCSELRALLSDYSKEKVLLKGELEEMLADKEALQKDLLEMKNALEKSTLENQELLRHIENMTSNLNSIPEKYDAVKKEPEKDDSTSLIENKEADLIALKTEQDFIQEDQKANLEHEKLITELQKKIDGLERDCKEREEKSNKIKAVAVKAKKELDANKKEVQSLRRELERVKAEKDQMSSSMKDVVQGAESYQNVLVEYDKQVELLENERKRANSAENRLEEITQKLRATLVEQEKLHSVIEDLTAHMETLQTNNKCLEAQIPEMQRVKAAMDKELEAEKLIKEQIIRDHTNALKQIEELQAQLQQEKRQLQKITQELELVRKDAQQSTLMDMEIADYERLVKELNQKLTHKCSQLEDLEQEISIQKQKQEALQQEISSLQTTVEQHEERSAKMKQLLVKSKKELADSKQVESDQLILQSSLKGELEASQQHVEAYKIQVAELTSEKHKVQEQLRALTEQHHRAANSYQQKLLVLQEECTAAKVEQAAVTAEFESYKVRVHNVLKQQKNKSASQAEHEAFKQEREHLQTMVDQLKNKLQEAQHNLQLSTGELQALQSEHDMLLERHNKMLQETVTKEAELREKLCAVQSENMVLKTEHAQVASQLSAQNEAQRNSFREQVRRLQDDHRKTVETLQQQMSKVEAQFFQAKSEISVTNSQQPTKSLRDRRPADLPMLDLYSVAREEGEGMETTDTDSVSSASTYIASLEQLLNASDSKTVAEPPPWQPELTKEDLSEKLNTALKRVDHLSVLLRETEATNAMLMEQITLLKNEVRRLERNQEREKSVSNMEYLKNVLLQFIFLKPGSERERLLPVIHTMLQLSPDEKGKLHAIAQGEEESVARPAGWASYLHSWSGLR